MATIANIMYLKYSTKRTTLKETRSATMNIFRNVLSSVLFKSFVKVELNYVCSNKSIYYSYKLHGKVNYLIKQVCFSLDGLVFSYFSK